jgi:RNA polymerase sigma factor (sigma-70 family)
MQSSSPLADHDLLAAMRQQERSAFQILYTFYYPTVERFVVRNNGSRADAEDIFQETLLVLLKKIPTDDFELTSSLKTYIFAVSSNLWLKRLRTAKRLVRTDFTDFDEAMCADDEAIIINESNHSERDESSLPRRIQRALTKISEHCQRLIQAIFFHNKNASELGYKNAHTAHNQRYKCMEQLRKATHHLNSQRSSTN